MFLNIKSKIMKQAQKYRQLSLFDNTGKKKAGTPLDQFEAPEEEQTKRAIPIPLRTAERMLVQRM